MINKSTKSNKIGAKYLLVLPLAASLLCLNNSKADNPAVIDAFNAVLAPEVIELQTQTLVMGDTVFSVVDEMPVFPGGEVALMNWISANIQYPAKAMENGIQGRVSVRFIVKADGTIGDTEVSRPVHPELDKEAVRVVKSLPKFQQGKQKGKAVAVYYHIPVRFRITGDTPKTTYGNKSPSIQ